MTLQMLQWSDDQFTFNYQEKVVGKKNWTIKWWMEDKKDCQQKWCIIISIVLMAKMVHVLIPLHHPLNIQQIQIYMILFYPIFSIIFILWLLIYSCSVKNVWVHSSMFQTSPKQLVKYTWCNYTSYQFSKSASKFYRDLNLF